MREPSAAVREEMIAILMADGSRVGQVYRLDQDGGLSQQDIADRLGVPTSNFVVNARTTVRALLEGKLPNGPAISRSVAGKARALRKTPGLSREAFDYLTSLSAALQPDDQTFMEPHASPLARVTTSREAVESLRVQVNAEIRTRVELLIGEIRASTGHHADDYARVVAAPEPLDELTTMVAVSPPRTFLAMHGAERLDLTLEQLVADAAPDLPLTRDLISAARGRLAYYSSKEASNE